jgi:hypothetical protein
MLQLKILNKQRAKSVRVKREIRLSAGNYRRLRRRGCAPIAGAARNAAARP